MYVFLKSYHHMKSSKASKTQEVTECTIRKTSSSENNRTVIKGTVDNDNGI